MGEQREWHLSGDLATVPRERGSDACVCELTSFSVSEQAAQHGDGFLIFKNPLLILLTGEHLLHPFSFFFYTVSDFHPFQNSPPQRKPAIGIPGFFFFITTAGLLLNLKWINQLTPGCIFEILGQCEDDFAESGLKSHFFSP